MSVLTFHVHLEETESSNIMYHSQRYQVSLLVNRLPTLFLIAIAKGIYSVKVDMRRIFK